MPGAGSDSTSSRCSAKGEVRPYATAVGPALAAFAHGYEEPTLHRRFGDQYEAYRQAVPAWWPRRHPWQSGQADFHLRPQRKVIARPIGGAKGRVWGFCTQSAPTVR